MNYPMFRGVFGLLLTVALLVSCVTIPKDYVPDDKVVFLMQDTGFGPIRYPAVATDPYVFKPDNSPVDTVNPAFIRAARFDTLLKPDFAADSRLYREVSAHFKYVLQLPLFLELRPLLDKADIKPAPPLPPSKGEKLQDYSNGAEYSYPDIPDAKISILTSGIYIIRFADKGLFQHEPSGIYFWKDSQGGESQYYDPSTGQVKVKLGDTVWEKGSNFRRMTGPKGTISFTTDPSPQYSLTPADKGAAQYTYFVDESGATKSCMVETANGLRFDYFPTEQSVMAQQGSQAVTIEADFRKFHAQYDTAKHRTGDLLSLYLPEGIRLTNLDASGVGYAELNPAWPEGYKMKPLGPFDIWYTSKDEALLAKIKPDRLTQIETKDRALTALAGANRRAIIIPPDLEAYRKLQAEKPGDILHWYPSGFETLDYITMWPLSVPRYDKPAGQDYFFNQEFYEIVTHEYVHILVGENAGVLGRSPVWLNEGLAVFVECQSYPETKKYWDTTFAVSRDLGRLLPWDDVTVKTTGEYPIAQARVEYAQSYALVSRLMEKFGAAKVAAYVMSFRTKSVDAAKVDLAAVYKTKFAKVFGITWEKALELLKPEPAKTK